MSTSISSDAHHDVLIIGAGHAGAQAAIALRQRKFAGAIGLLWDETGLPYERPPLSKEYLSGSRPAERLLIRPEKFWSAQAVTLMPGRRVAGLDAGERRVELSDGSTLRYGTIIWAAGGRARRLACAGSDLAGVFTLRTRGDVDGMRVRLADARRVVVIGGGYIGLEVAATLRKLGCDVTVVEQADRVLARVAGPTLAHFFEAEHRRHGVEIRLSARVSHLEGHQGSVTGVTLVDGETLSADLVVVGIGIEPIVEPLRTAGAAGRDGVDVDAACQTSLDHVFAIGDCAAQATPFGSDLTPRRIESVANAAQQALAVARFLTGEGATAHAVPWFWSDQYDLRLQTAGLSSGHDESVVRGSPDSRSFSVIYRRAGRVVALDCVNAPADFAQGKVLVATGASPLRERLLDTASSPRG